MKYLYIILIALVFVNCNKRNSNMDDKIKYLVDVLPGNKPIKFKPELVSSNMLIHSGIFSLDLNEYYYTVSDKEFKKFDIKVIKKTNGKWSEPEFAFFNTKFSEHGMTFSPDGKYLYFSSTRPVNSKEVSNTWHIWRIEKKQREWGGPEFVDIPNMRKKLVSHPAITNSGEIYFHASNLDYSDMDIYFTRQINNNYEPAKRISVLTGVNKCTPFVAPDSSYLLFASIGKELDLMISFKDRQGSWLEAKKINKEINNNGQGNPYITPDGKYLFFAAGKHSEDYNEGWSIKWVKTENILNIKNYE